MRVAATISRHNPPSYSSDFAVLVSSVSRQTLIWPNIRFDFKVSAEIRNDVSLEHCEIGGGDVLAVGAEEGVQVLPEEEIGAVHPRRHRPRPARRATHTRHHSAHRSCSQRRLHQRQGNALSFFIFIFNQFSSVLGEDFGYF